MTPDLAEHWQGVYSGKRPDEVSWFEPLPQQSLELIEAIGLPLDAGVVDVGGGASGLAAHLLDAGYTDVAVADVSSAALAEARTQLGDRADAVQWVEADVRSHDFERRFDLWHDRALFHFMVEPSDRDAYLESLRRTVSPVGHVVIATFGPKGPTQCSGLPVVRYGAGELSEALGHDFELQSRRSTNHRTPTGSLQQFLYAHFQRTPE